MFFFDKEGLIVFITIRPTLRMLFGASGACFMPVNLTVDVQSLVQNSIWMVPWLRVFNRLPGVVPSISDGSALNSIKWFLFRAMCVIDPVSANQSDAEILAQHEKSSEWLSDSGFMDSRTVNAKSSARLLFSVACLVDSVDSVEFLVESPFYHLGA